MAGYETLVADYLGHLIIERNASPRTVAGYGGDLRDFAAFWARAHATPLEPPAITRATVRAWLIAQGGRGCQAATQARRLRALRGCLRFAVTEGVLSTNVALEVEPPKVPRQTPRPLTEAEALALIEAPPGRARLPKRDRALVEVMYGCGLRASEVIGLSVGDLDRTAGAVRVYGKGRKVRTLPVTRHALEALAAYWPARGRLRALAPDHPEAPLFVSQRGARLTYSGLRDLLRRLARRARLETRMHSHRLRTSCASHLLDHEADLESIRELLGHASLATTQVYLKASAARLRAVTLRHPRAA